MIRLAGRSAGQTAHELQGAEVEFQLKRRALGVADAQAVQEAAAGVGDDPVGGAPGPQHQLVGEVAAAHEHRGDRIAGRFR
jgi:hypothetical protein